MIDLKIDTREVEKALAKTQKATGRAASDIIGYTGKLLLRKVAHATRRADRADLPQSKKDKAGRARAGWYKAWEGLGIPGKAYATASAVRQFAEEGVFVDNRRNANHPHIVIQNNVPYIRRLTELPAEVSTIVQSQAGKAASFAEKKLNSQIGKLF